MAGITFRFWTAQSKAGFAKTRSANQKDRNSKTKTAARLDSGFCRKTDSAERSNSAEKRSRITERFRRKSNRKGNSSSKSQCRSYFPANARPGRWRTAGDRSTSNWRQWSFSNWNDRSELNVRVVNAANRPVGDLKQAQFKIYEDDILQPITSMTTAEIPLINALVIDNSRSLRSQLPKVIEAGKIIIQPIVRKTNRPSSVLSVRTRSRSCRISRPAKICLKTRSIIYLSKAGRRRSLMRFIRRQKKSSNIKTRKKKKMLNCARWFWFRTAKTAAANTMKNNLLNSCAIQTCRFTRSDLSII